MSVAEANKCSREKTKKELCEEWDKKKPQPVQLQKNKGKFQQPPRFPFNNFVKAEGKVMQVATNRDGKFQHRGELNIKRKKVVRVTSNKDPIKSKFGSKITWVKETDTSDILKYKAYVVKTVCPMPNLQNNCWFNAISQALVHTDLITTIMENLNELNEIKEGLN